jgi:hypothetical protein
MTHPRTKLIARCVLTVIVTAGLVPLQIATSQRLSQNISPAVAAASVTISPGVGGDDTQRIQNAIYSTSSSENRPASYVAKLVARLVVVNIHNKWVSR